jgi:hypothetical protein
MLAAFGDPTLPLMPAGRWAKRPICSGSSLSIASDRNG